MPPMDLLASSAHTWLLAGSNHPDKYAEKLDAQTFSAVLDHIPLSESCLSKVEQCVSQRQSANLSTATPQGTDSVFNFFESTLPVEAPMPGLQSVFWGGATPPSVEIEQDYEPLVKDSDFPMSEGAAVVPTIAPDTKPYDCDLQTIVGHKRWYNGDVKEAEGTGGFVSKQFGVASSAPSVPQCLQRTGAFNICYSESDAGDLRAVDATMKSVVPDQSGPALSMADPIAQAMLRSQCSVDMAAVENSRPKRRNVKISTDPQSVAARHRRERITDRFRILQNMVPGTKNRDYASMLDVVIDYVKYLQDAVQMLERLNIGNGIFDPSLSFGQVSFQPRGMPDGLCS